MARTSTWWTGSDSPNSFVIDGTITVAVGQKDLHVAIWWPDRLHDAHDDVDLYVMGPGGVNLGSN
jgi:hypothetical protein